MPPPTMSWSTCFASDLRIVSLVETLEPATMATTGRAGLRITRSSASSSAISSGPAQATGAKAGDAMRTRLGAVRGTESIHDVDVAELRHLPGQRRIVLFLARVEAHVLAQHDFAAGDLEAMQPVANQRHAPAEQFGQTRRNRPQ